MSSNVEKELEFIRDALNKMPKADRFLIARDLKQFPDGIPENVTYKPGTWCGKTPIDLPSGDEGLLVYLEYASGVGVKNKLCSVAKSTGMIVVAVAIYVLLGRKLNLPLPDALKAKAVESATIDAVGNIVGNVVEDVSTAAVVENVSSSICTDALNSTAVDVASEAAAAVVKDLL